MYYVVSHKNITKAVWNILVQLSSLNSTIYVVPGIGFQVSVFRCQETDIRSSKVERASAPAGTACDEPFGRGLRAERFSRVEVRPASPMHCLLTPETRHLKNKAVFCILKAGHNTILEITMKVVQKGIKCSV